MPSSISYLYSDDNCHMMRYCPQLIRSVCVLYRQIGAKVTMSKIEVITLSVLFFIICNLPDTRKGCSKGS